MFYVLAGMIGFCLGASVVWYILHYGISMNDIKTQDTGADYEIHHHKTMKVMGMHSKSIVYPDGTTVKTPEFLNSYQAASYVADWTKKDE